MTSKGFLMLLNEFNFFTELGPVAFRIAVYLAAKPDDWVVKEGDVRKQCKKIGHDAYRQAIHELIGVGMLKRGVRVEGKNQPPVILDEMYLRIRAGHRLSPIPNLEPDQVKHDKTPGHRLSPIPNLEPDQVKHDKTPGHRLSPIPNLEPDSIEEADPNGEVSPGHSQDGYPTLDTRPITNTYSTKTDLTTTPTQDHVSQAVSFADKSLADLVAEAPELKALEALYRAHKGQWSAQVNELAKARKAELASASVSEPEPESVSPPKPTQPACVADWPTGDVDDVDQDDETCTMYEDYEAESRFSSAELTGYRAKTSLAEWAG